MTDKLIAAKLAMLQAYEDMLKKGQWVMSSSQRIFAVFLIRMTQFLTLSTSPQPAATLVDTCIIQFRKLVIPSSHHLPQMSAAWHVYR
jgi:hypothetical protein